MTILEVAAAHELSSVRVLSPARHSDERGFFSEVWREDALARSGISCRFVQENHARSSAVGTVRGLHFQIGDAAQAKLVRCPRGSIFDVAVDIRRDSPSFGRHFATVLSEENWKQLYVPPGFAHGYCTLATDSEVIYKVSAYYDPQSERGLAWDDPELAIAWPLSGAAAMLTQRDREWPRLRELGNCFSYEEWPTRDAKKR
jgi:dTDP-4-dehydrorhamnose 3,5-epimerase